MKKRSLFLFFALCAVLASILESCKYNNQEELHPNCDTTGVTYSGTVVPILQANCYRCHGDASNTGSGGIILQDYNVLKGFAADGQLYGNIAHLPGFHNMPYDGGKLADCEIAKIKRWIDNGYPNN